MAMVLEIVAGLVVLLGICIVLPKKKISWRTLVAFSLVTVGWGCLVISSYGYPRYLNFVFKPSQIYVIAARVNPVDETIFVWTGEDIPMSYHLQWSEAMAEQIVEGLATAHANGDGGITLNVENRTGISAPGEATYQVMPTSVGEPEKDE